MIKHIVLFNIDINYSAEEKERALKEIIDKLSELPNNIKEIKHYEVFRNMKDGGSDFGLISYFDSKEDLEIYREHPMHQEAIKIIGKHSELKTFIDFIKADFLYK